MKRRTTTRGAPDSEGDGQGLLLIGCIFIYILKILVLSVDTIEALILPCLGSCTT